MTGYTVHTGSTEKFSEGWDRIFREQSTSKKRTSGKRGAKGSQANQKKKSSKKKAGGKASQAKAKNKSGGKGKRSAGKKKSK